MSTTLKIVGIVVGVLAVLAAGGFYLDYSQKKSGTPALTTMFTNSGTSATTKNSNGTVASVKLENLGQAPEFTGISKWLNSEPLTLANLKGKVVLVDFWTYSCINCIRTLPYVTKWYDTYKDQGFVVVGVHTPEFAFEKVTDNVQTAMKRFGINYPVAQDNDYKTWNAYKNQFWPAHYLIDQNGTIVYTHFGEGNYEETEAAIRQLLKTDKAMADTPAEAVNKAQTPEIYFGTSRLEAFGNDERAVNAEQLYAFPKSLKTNQFALEGSWQFDAEKATLVRGLGKIRLNFNAKNAFFVAQSPRPVTVKVYIDGQFTKALVIKDSQLYTLFEGSDSGKHQLELEIPQGGLEAFTFTFG
jgi:thiol-disulfide isomerase/thioredoxin